MGIRCILRGASRYLTLPTQQAHKDLLFALYMNQQTTPAAEAVRTQDARTKTEHHNSRAPNGLMGASNSLKLF